MSHAWQAGLPKLATVVVVTLGVTLVWRVTLGLHSYTWESYRRLQVLEEPVAMPVLTLQDDTGRVFSSAELRGRPLVVNFIYTRCNSVCLASGDAYGRLQRTLEAGRYRGRVRLLSISLDPDHDGPEPLRAYRARYGDRSGDSWRIARVRSSAEMSTLLTRFGVVSIPDGFGGITHNAAAHLVDGTGHLVRILDEADYPAILQWLDEQMEDGRVPR